MTALMRGLFLAIITGVLAFLTAWERTDDLKAAAITGGVTACSAILARWGVEGGVDASRQRRGDIRPSDVQAFGRRD